MLFIQLPSGIRLVYVKQRMGLNRFESEAVTYEGIGGTKKWERIESYGAKFLRISCRLFQVTYFVML